MSYIELSNVAVSISINHRMNVFCALFHDTEDGMSLGKLLSVELLQAFVDKYALDLNDRGGAHGEGRTVGHHNLRDFDGFHHQMHHVIQNAIRPILAWLQQQRGIVNALVVTKHSIVHSTSSSEVDQLGVLANLQSVLNLSTDVMTLVDDVVHSIDMEGPKDTMLKIHRIDTSTLIVMYRTAPEYQPQVHQHIQQAID